MPGNYIMYLRKSRSDRDYGEESVELTLSRHRERLDELCGRMSIQCATVLQEVGSADSIAARPEMMKLLQLVETGSYDGVVCVDMDRLSRGSGADQALVINTFKYSDTKVITPMKTYDFALETDEQFAELSLFIAKQEYRAIKKRLYQGRLDSTKEGKWSNAKAPYGYETYKLKGQKGFSLRIIPEEASFVQMLFNYYLESGHGCSVVAQELSALGYKTRDGYPLSTRWVHTILTNPVYTGKVRFSRYKYTTLMEDGEVVHKTRINKTPYICEGLHDPIIDQDTFDRAQEILFNNWKGKTHKDRELVNPLSKVMVCGFCGGHFKIHSESIRNGRPQLGCKTTGCKCRGAYLDLVEDRILSALDQWLYDLEFGADGHDSGAELVKTIESLREKKRASEAKLARQMDAYENGVYDLDDYRRRSDQTREELESINAQIDDIKKKIDGRAAIVPKLRNVSEKYRSLETATEKRLLLLNLLEKIEYKKTTQGRNHKDDFEIILYPKLPS